jgi:dTMP kinase
MLLRNFVVFEGIDGTGTTTQLDRLKARYAERFSGEKVPVFFTCEPTGSEIGKLVRKGLKGDPEFTPDTMARLFAADRGEHIYGKDGIVSHLKEGYAVYSDRYFFSSLAYQGSAGDPDLPRALNRDFPLPEYLFFFDIDPDAAMDRVERRALPLEIYEKREFQKRVRERYLEVIADYERSESEMRVIRIDAARPIDEIAEKIWSIAQNLPKIGT